MVRKDKDNSAPSVHFQELGIWTSAIFSVPQFFAESARQAVREAELEQQETLVEEGHLEMHVRGELTELPAKRSTVPKPLPIEISARRGTAQGQR